MSLFEILVSVQIVVMLLAGLFVYITGRDNKSREREMQLQRDLLKSELENEIQKAEARVRHGMRNEFQAYVSGLMQDVEELKDRQRER